MVLDDDGSSPTECGPQGSRLNTKHQAVQMDDVW
jgi:hypothetical protein